MYRKCDTSTSSDIILTFFSESQDNKDKAYLFKKKMIGKQLNKIIAWCQLNWQIINCVEELLTNFLTNTVQEENLNVFINEINKKYTPKFLTKGSENNEIHKLLEEVKTRLNEIKNLKLNELNAGIKTLKEMS